jgi:hypothetical protein
VCRKREREALGWREFSKGIENLKAINSPIRHALKVSDSLQYYREALSAAETGQGQFRPP